jgi:hypothetical protein
MDRLEQNHRITRNDRLQRLPVPPFSKCERALIRLGGLLHDLAQVTQFALQNRLGGSARAGWGQKS